MRRTAALIVGGGPAGAAAAITLADAGLRPLLIERGPERHGVCGGFLGWDALPMLARLGVDPAALGARPIARVRILAGNRVAETRLPGPAAGLSRATLDAALLALAERKGAEIRRGLAVRSVEGSCARLADGGQVEADALFIATGKYALRGATRDGTGPTYVGLRATLRRAPARLDGTIELHLFAGGYAGLLILEDGSANLCLSVSAKRFRAAGGSAAGLADTLVEDAPALARLMAEAEPEWSAVAGVPYGWRAHDTEPGRFRIGDQAAVVASLVGDGIAMALTSGDDAARAMIGGGAGAAPPFQRRLARQQRAPIFIAELARAIGERPPLARLALPLLRRAPGLIRVAANATRVPVSRSLP